MNFYCNVYIFLLLCIFCFHRANWHSSATLTEDFPVLCCKAYAGVYLVKTGHGPHSSQLGNGPQSSQLGNNFYVVISSLILVWSLWVRIPESLPTKVVNCVVLCTVCV